MVEHLDDEKPPAQATKTVLKSPAATISLARWTLEDRLGPRLGGRRRWT
jgi:hypothetical protein